MRRLLPLIAGLLLLCQSAAARADVRERTIGDPADTPGSAIDISGARVAVDRSNGAVSVSFTFHGPIPEPTAPGSRIAVDVVNECDEEYGSVGDRGEWGLSLMPSYTYEGGRRYVWEATARVYGPYGSRSVTPSVTFSPDRRQVTMLFGDPLLVGSEAACVQPSSSWNEWHDDPAVKPGPYSDKVSEMYFAGLECARRPALALSAVKEVVYGRWGDVTVRALNGRLERASLAYALAGSSTPFYAKTFGPGKDLDEEEDEVAYGIRIDEGEPPATVSLTWSQSGGELCTATPVVVKAVRGRTPAVRTARDGGAGVVRLRMRGGCQRARMGKIEISLLQSGRKRVLSKKEACGRWSRRGQLRGIRAVPAASGHGVRLTATGNTRARLVARFDGKVVMRRMVTAKYRRHRGYRIYAWNGLESNDEYWNVCVNEPRETYMHKGNAYCVEPGRTERSITFGRR